jgi:hypothetical protein
MATASMSSILRTILTANPGLSNDEVVRKAKARGVSKPDAVIKHNLYNIRAEFNKLSSQAVPIPAKSAARQTSAPKPVVTPKPAPVAVQTGERKASAPKSLTAVKPATNTAATSSPAVDLDGVFSNVTLVNTVVTVCGGVDQTRQVAEAVRACGNLEAFLQHLDLVAGLRASAAATA